MALYTQNFQSKGRQEEKMTWRLLSSVAKKGTIFKSPGIFVRPTFKGGHDIKSKDPWAKILTANQFLLFKITLENILCGPFSLHTTSKGRQVERPAFQE
jgi:hypothetical protein